MKGNNAQARIKQERVPINAYISKDTHSKLLQIADKNDLSLSDVIRLAVNEYANKQATAS